MQKLFPLRRTKKRRHLGQIVPRAQLGVAFRWRSLRESNPCFSLERAAHNGFPAIAGNCPSLLSIYCCSIILDYPELQAYLQFARSCLPVLTPRLPLGARPMKLTKRTAAAVKADPARDIYAWDDEMRGFGLRVKPSGVRSFIVQYRNASGISRRITVGKLGVLTPEEARKSAKRMLADVTHGRDPAAKRSDDRKAMTVRQLCHTYLEAAAKGLVLGKRGQPKRPSTLYTDRGRIERYVLPLLGRKALRDLTTPDIVRFMRNVAAGGRGAATRTVGLLGGILSFAVAEGLIPVNPARGVKRPADQRREVRLTDDEYRIIGRALSEAKAENPAAITAIKLLALTGCRRNEIVWLRWSEVDLTGRCLRLTDSKEGKSIRPIGRAAVELLAALPKEDAYVLPGPSIGKPYSGLPRAWQRIIKPTSLGTLTPHGLRHAYASMASDLGYAEPTIAALLGHATRSMTSRYIHHLDAALIAAADTVADRIAAALDGREMAPHVVQLRRRSVAA